MKKINAYIGDCISENIDVIIDDYQNKEGNSEFSINLNVGLKLNNQLYIFHIVLCNKNLI